MQGIIDRFEGDYVVIEIDGKTLDVEREKVEYIAVVGDVVEYVDGKWVVNKELTEKRGKEIKKLMNEVWED